MKELKSPDLVLFAISKKHSLELVSYHMALVFLSHEEVTLYFWVQSLWTFTHMIPVIEPLLLHHFYKRVSPFIFHLLSTRLLLFIVFSIMNFQLAQSELQHLFGISLNRKLDGPRTARDERRRTTHNEGKYCWHYVLCLVIIQHNFNITLISYGLSTLCKLICT